MNSDRAIYHILWILFQYCGIDDDSYIGTTRFNAEAGAVDELEKIGYVKILSGKWPLTKFLTFEITQKGLDLMGIDAL